jgi:hypothetical protein
VGTLCSPDALRLFVFCLTTPSHSSSFTLLAKNASCGGLCSRTLARCGGTPSSGSTCTGLSSTAGSAPSLVQNTSACLETDPPKFRFLFDRQPVLHRSLQHLVALDLRLCFALVADFDVAIVIDRILVRRVPLTFRVLGGRRLVLLVRLKGGQLIVGIAKP